MTPLCANLESFTAACCYMDTRRECAFKSSAIYGNGGVLSMRLNSLLIDPVRPGLTPIFKITAEMLSGHFDNLLS